MAVYDESEGKQWIAFYTSPDLKAWTFRSRIEGFFECPDLFELPVDGDATRRKWVLTAASSEYMVGHVRRRNVPSRDAEAARPSRPWLLRGADVQPRSPRPRRADRLAPDGDAGDAVQPGDVAAAGAEPACHPRRARAWPGSRSRS